MKELKILFFYFFMLKSVLKCIESIRIKKKMVKKKSNFESQLGGRGGGRAIMSISRFLHQILVGQHVFTKKIKTFLGHFQCGWEGGQGSPL